MHFRTRAELQAWVMESIANAFTYAIVFNPRGAYDVIQRWWPGAFPTMEQGAESSELQMNKMHDFLEAKAAQAGNMGGQLATDFVAAVPPATNFNSYDTFLIK